MTERENNVYKAKLAEQAERYDGKFNKKKRKKNFFPLSAERQLWGGVMQSLWRRVACVTLKNCLYISYISGRQEKLGIFNFVDIYV